MGGHLLWAEALPRGSSLLYSSVVPRGPQEQLEYLKAGWDPALSLRERPGISLTPPVPDSAGTAPDRTPQPTPCACEGQPSPGHPPPGPQGGSDNFPITEFLCLVLSGAFFPKKKKRGSCWKAGVAGNVFKKRTRATWVSRVCL